jgi:hypothetical protein
VLGALRYHENVARPQAHSLLTASADLDADAELPGRCRVEAWAPRIPGISYDLDRRRLSPHAYVISRRIDAVRRLMLRGAAPADAAAAVGFYDRAHFTRHFKRHTAATPASYARSHTRRAA